MAFFGLTDSGVTSHLKYCGLGRFYHTTVLCGVYLRSFSSHLKESKTLQPSTPDDAQLHDDLISDLRV